MCLVAQSCPTLCDPMDGSLPGSFVHGDSPGKNTGMGCHALLQGIFPTQGSNPGLKHRSPALLADSLLSEPLLGAQIVEAKCREKANYFSAMTLPKRHIEGCMPRKITCPVASHKS